MSLPAYREYKDSGIEWLGKLPHEWRAMKTRLSLVEPPCYGVLVPDFQVGGVPMIRITDIQQGVVSKEGLVTISDELSAQYHRTITNAGDVLLSVVGTIGEVVVVDESIAGVNLSRSLARLQVSHDLDRFYLAWVLRSDIFRRYVDLVCVGSAQRVLNMSDLSSFVIPVPPVPEQSSITGFLDRETGKIDVLIAEQEKLLTLLAEKRQATISHAVTRGLDPNAPMKDSGVAWLGEVPAHWDVIPLKHLSPVQRGASPRPIDDPKYFDEDGEYSWVRITDVSASDGYLEATPQKLSELGSSLSVKLKPGDLFVSIAGTVGKPCISRIQACIHDGFVYFPRLEVPPIYLYRIFEAGVCYAGLGKMGTQLNLNTETIGSIRVALPPARELGEILAFLDKTLARLDSLRTEAECGIALLKERRSALIAAAVTGKIDVRQAA